MEASAVSPLPLYPFLFERSLKWEKTPASLSLARWEESRRENTLASLPFPRWKESKREKLLPLYPSLSGRNQMGRRLLLIYPSLGGVFKELEALYLTS